MKDIMDKVIKIEAEQLGVNAEDVETFKNTIDKLHPLTKKATKTILDALCELATMVPESEVPLIHQIVKTYIKMQESVRAKEKAETIKVE